MKADGLFYLVAVRLEEGLAPLAYVHSARLGMPDELLEADGWLANVITLAEEPPDSPEGLDG